MSKAWLEDMRWLEYLEEYYPRDAAEYTNDIPDVIQYAKEQAERVQELERVNKQLKNNLSVYKGYYKNMIKINEGIVDQNKRYREVIGEVREYANSPKILTNPAGIENILAKALEESE